jgi:hypothetical protein
MKISLMTSAVFALAISLSPIDYEGLRCMMCIFCFITFVKGMGE